MKIIASALALCVCLNGTGHTECEPPHAIHTAAKQIPTQEELDARYRVYLAACTKVGGELIDAASVTYQDRIAGGVLGRISLTDTYPENLLRRGITGEVSVAAVVETTGKVSVAMLIGTSGYKDFDRNALYQIRQYRYERPFTLDGVPVRVFRTYVITYHTG